MIKAPRIVVYFVIPGLDSLAARLGNLLPTKTAGAVPQLVFESFGGAEGGEP